MILQSANIVSGFLLSTTKFKEHEAIRGHVERAEKALAPFLEKIGLVVLAFGAIGLLVRMGVNFLWIPMLGASFPQSIPAILIGLILSRSYWEKYPSVYGLITSLLPHRIVIGLVGIASGLGSLLFGCVLPVVCGIY